MCSHALRNGAVPDMVCALTFCVSRTTDEEPALGVAAIFHIALFHVLVILFSISCISCIYTSI